MKVNQSLTAAITAAALVAGAGFAYAQSTNPQVTNTPDASSAQGPMVQNQGTTPMTPGTMDNSTMQAQPAPAPSSVDSTPTLEPRADRN